MNTLVVPRHHAAAPGVAMGSRFTRFAARLAGAARTWMERRAAPHVAGATHRMGSFDAQGSNLAREWVERAKRQAA